MSTDRGDTPKGNVDPSQWVSQSEASNVRNVTRQAISRLVKKGRFTTLLIGGKKLLNSSEVEAFTPKAPGPVAKKKTLRRSKKQRGRQVRGGN